MGLTTQYHRYNASGVFSVIGSNTCNVVWLEYEGEVDRYCAVGACENVIIWDVQTQTKMATLFGEKSAVVHVAASPNKKHLSVAYTDGNIKVFDIASGEEVVVYSGHKISVSVLAYDELGMTLASGGKDTEIILWDTVGECGLYRLKGHKGVITDLRFMKTRKILISCSKDTFVKFWDLETQHCFRTLFVHTVEVYALTLNFEETRLYTGAADSEIRVWTVKPLEADDDVKEESPDEHSDSKKIKDDPERDSKSVAAGGLQEEERILSCKYLGSFMRTTKGRTVNLRMDPTGRILACHGTDRQVEIFLVLTEEEKEAELRKKQKTMAKRDPAAVKRHADDFRLSADKELRSRLPLKFSGKIVDVQIATPSSAKSCQVLTFLNNNSMELNTIPLRLDEWKSKPEKSGELALMGHRTNAHAICFSQDSTTVASASSEHVKVWNVDSLQCIRTMDCDYALCCSFLPGDRHLVVGCKSGKLQLFDIGSDQLLETFDAHTSSLWSLCLSPDKRGLVTGGDNSVKFWQYELISDEDTETSDVKRLTLAETRVLQMADNVLCVRLSEDKRLLAVSLLDNTIKVFFADTLKFFLSLYGHSLPAICIDISTDGTLLVSGSADKNIKIWGLDFGDCHKSLFAHDDNVMAVAFLPRTHHVVSCGKDGAIKQWDADNFQNISTMQPPHHGAVWDLAVTANGMTLATTSADRSLRLWEKSSEIIVLEEERQMEREREYDAELEKEENPVVPGETTDEVGFANKKTVSSVKATERIMEAVELWRTERNKIITNENELHPVLRAFKCKTPQDYVLISLQKIKPSELEQALIVTPFDYAIDLLKIIEGFIQVGESVELLNKCLLFLLRIHHGQITSNQMLLPTLDKLKTTCCAKVQEFKDRIGFNLSALQLLRLKLEEGKDVKLFANATERHKKRKKQVKSKLDRKTWVDDNDEHIESSAVAEAESAEADKTANVER